MLWTYYFKKKKKICGAKVEGKKKKRQIFPPFYFGNAIATKQFATFFFPFYFGTTVFFRNDMSTTFSQLFYNKS